jgi:hypothetical protein
VTAAVATVEPTLDAAVESQIERAGHPEIVVGLLTYNNAETLGPVASTTAGALAQHFPGAVAAFVNADASSTDGTADLLAGLPLPAVLARHDAPISERGTVPFHGVPGRGAGLYTVLAIARRLGARVLLLLEADLGSLDEDWIARLAGPVWQEKADLVSPAYARHRYDGTITNLLLAPLVRALFGRRLHQPLGGQQALSGRLVEHLLDQTGWSWRAREIPDIWILGRTVADGFAVNEAWLGRRVVRSRARATDLPAMVAQTLGAVFTTMDRVPDLWLEVSGSEPVPALGEAALPSIEPREVDIVRMVDAFQLGLRDLTPIWEQILNRDTLGDVLSLGVGDPRAFRFPDELWARVVYDFALGHHYGVVHRDHLLRSLVPLYLGRVAAYVLAAERRTAEASEALVEHVGAAFEQRKPYLVDNWR